MNGKRSVLATFEHNNHEDKRHRRKECKKLGVALAHSVIRKRLFELTELDARRDGFKDLAEFLIAFHSLHPEIEKNTEVDIIRFVWVNHYKPILEVEKQP
jgi:hypothetical protein